MGQSRMSRIMAYNGILWHIFQVDSAAESVTLPRGQKIESAIPEAIADGKPFSATTGTRQRFRQTLVETCGKTACQKGRQYAIMRD